MPAPAPQSNPTTPPAPPTSTVSNEMAGKDPVREPEKKSYPKRGFVQTATGATMRHLHTDQVIDGRPVKIDIDAFAAAQLDAGKWVLVDPTKDD